MGQRHLEQKIRDSLVKNEKPRRGQTCSASSTQRKRQRKCRKQLRDRRLVTNGRRSFGEACAFNDPNKKGKGKGRPRSPSPTGSPHRNSKGNATGGDDGSAQGTPKLTVKSPSGKANRLVCTNLKKGSCHRGRKCNHWHGPECMYFKAPGGCRFGDKCAHKHTAILADEKANLASILCHIPIEFLSTDATTENSVG